MWYLRQRMSEYSSCMWKGHGLRSGTSSTCLRNQIAVCRKNRLHIILQRPFFIFSRHSVYYGIDNSTRAHLYNMLKETVMHLIFTPLLFLYGKNYFMYKRIISYTNIECLFWKHIILCTSVRYYWINLLVRPTWVQTVVRALVKNMTSIYTHTQPIKITDAQAHNKSRYSE